MTCFRKTVMNYCPNCRELRLFCYMRPNRIGKENYVMLSTIIWVKSRYQGKNKF